MDENFLIRLLHWLSRRFERCPYLRALGQAPNQVVVREAGKRFLSVPRPIQRYAAQHWEYAWLADAAYGESRVARKAQFEATDPEAPGAALAKAGWVRWENFPMGALQAKFKKWHLRVQVWQKDSPPAVAVAFGGTVFRNEMDWRANLRWFWPGKTDQYTLTQLEFANEFPQEWMRRIAAGKSPATLELFSTGHSLGGGLAQQFAYALPLVPLVSRISKVFAFDPSPVTGYSRVDRQTRERNCVDLKIDRIYERGEILAIARSLTSFFIRPKAQNPEIRGVRYNLFYTCNPIAGHSMKMLAGKLEAAAGGSPTPENP
jgi:hypothetical protein